MAWTGGAATAAAAATVVSIPASFLRDLEVISTPFGSRPPCAVDVRTIREAGRTPVEPRFTRLSTASRLGSTPPRARTHMELLLLGPIEARLPDGPIPLGP